MCTKYFSAIVVLNTWWSILLSTAVIPHATLVCCKHQILDDMSRMPLEPFVAADSLQNSSWQPSDSLQNPSWEPSDSLRNPSWQPSDSLLCLPGAPDIRSESAGFHQTPSGRLSLCTMMMLCAVQLVLIAAPMGL